MADQKVIITSTNPGGQTMQKTLTDINPEAGNTELKTFAQMLNGLTDNVYGRTDRVIKIHCDSEAGDEKQTPTFTLAKTTDTKANLLAAVNTLDNKMLCYTFNYSYNGDGVISVACNHESLAASIYKTSQSLIAVCSPITIAQLQNEITQDVTFTFTAEETDNFKAASATFTITV